MPKSNSLSTRLDFEWFDGLVPANRLGNAVSEFWGNSVEDRY